MVVSKCGVLQLISCEYRRKRTLPRSMVVWRTPVGWSVPGVEDAWHGALAEGSSHLLPEGCRCGGCLAVPDACLAVELRDMGGRALL